MKTAFSILLLTLASASLCSATVKTVKTTGRLGAGEHCSGFGVCEVKTTTSQTPTGLVLSWTLNTTQTVLTLFIASDQMQNVPDDIADELERGDFVMSASFTFPSDVTTALEGESPLTISAGTYAASHAVDGYTINFSIE